MKISIINPKFQLNSSRSKMRNRTRNNVIMLAPSLTVMEMSCTYQPDSRKHKATSINLATNQNEYQPRYKPK
jgi:hypothetical protein